MNIGEKLRALRVAQNLSQGDVQKRTGLTPHYISRLENGHTVPALCTLDRIAKALELPLHVLVYEVDPPSREAKRGRPNTNGHSNKDHHYFEKLTRLLEQTTPERRDLIMTMAKEMAKHDARPSAICCEEHGAIVERSTNP